MKSVVIGPLLVVGLLTAMTVLSLPAQAQSNYPWCAYYAHGFSGTNCGFVSFDQCMDTVRGIGGFCQKNDWYHPAATAPQRSARTRRRTQS